MNEQRNLNTPYEPGNPEYDNSVGGLLRQLTREVPSLFTKELALAKAELNESLRATKAGAASVATGGAVLLAGFIILLMSAVYFLSTMMEPWLAALIVGVVVVGIGMIMVSAGSKPLRSNPTAPSIRCRRIKKS